MSDPYIVKTPRRGRIPIVISAPHVGTDFPTTLASAFSADMVADPQDTDWLVHELYDFALDLGITIIHATYSRYVIDLNRDPENRPLYGDARVQTNLVPTKSFQGAHLYRDRREEIAAEDVAQRLESFYWPYYSRINSLLSDLQRDFSHVLLYDAHSIARVVPSISKVPFPDLILGSNDGKSAAGKLVSGAFTTLERSSYSVAHNQPFKGGHITRYFGNPAKKVHALQLERSQDIYLHEGRVALDQSKVTKLQPVLSDVLTVLHEQLKRL